jgi:hypothetical protein
MGHADLRSGAGIRPGTGHDERQGPPVLHGRENRVQVEQSPIDPVGAQQRQRVGRDHVPVLATGGGKEMDAFARRDRYPATGANRHPVPADQRDGLRMASRG